MMSEDNHSETLLNKKPDTLDIPEPNYRDSTISSVYDDPRLTNSVEDDNARKISVVVVDSPVEDLSPRGQPIPPPRQQKIRENEKETKLLPENRSKRPYQTTVLPATKNGVTNDPTWRKERNTYCTTCNQQVLTDVTTNVPVWYCTYKILCIPFFAIAVCASALCNRERHCNCENPHTNNVCDKHFDDAHHRCPNCSGLIATYRYSAKRRVVLFLLTLALFATLMVIIIAAAVRFGRRQDEIAVLSSTINSTLEINLTTTTPFVNISDTTDMTTTNVTLTTVPTQT